MHSSYAYSGSTCRISKDVKYVVNIWSFFGNHESGKDRCTPQILKYTYIILIIVCILCMRSNSGMHISLRAAPTSRSCAKY